MHPKKPHESSPIFAILILGTANSGKSTFINHVLEASQSSHRVYISEDMDTGTVAVEEVAIPMPTFGDVMMVDTPGFDHTALSDAEVFERIADWLKNLGEHVKIRGVLYIHDISRDWISQATRMSIDIFEKLCGEEAIRNGMARIVTVKWSRIRDQGPAVGTDRETQLRGGLWANLVQMGCGFDKLTEDAGCAKRIVESVLANSRAVDTMGLHLQQELRIGRPWTTTDAGRCLPGSFGKDSAPLSRAKPGHPQKARPGHPLIDATSHNGTGSARGPNSIVREGATIEGRKDDIVFILIGQIKAGKSTLINRLFEDFDTTEVRVKVGTNLSSCTLHIEPIPLDRAPERRGELNSLLGGRRIVLVDTPGFDNTNLRDDDETLQRILHWLVSTYGTGMPIGTILYLHDITRDDFSLKDLGHITNVCGADRVGFVTTKWDKLCSLQEGRDRAKELVEDGKLWAPMINQGAVVHHLRPAGDFPEIVEETKDPWDIISAMIIAQRRSSL